MKGKDSSYIPFFSSHSSCERERRSHLQYLAKKKDNPGLENPPVNYAHSTKIEREKDFLELYSSVAPPSTEVKPSIAQHVPIPQDYTFFDAVQSLQTQAPKPQARSGATASGSGIPNNLCGRWKGHGRRTTTMTFSCSNGGVELCDENGCHSGKFGRRSGSLGFVLHGHEYWYEIRTTGNPSIIKQAIFDGRGSQLTGFTKYVKN